MGHLTGIGSNDVIAFAICSTLAASPVVDVGPTTHTVSQPARGHHVRFLSNSISERGISHIYEIPLLLY